MDDMNLSLQVRELRKRKAWGFPPVQLFRKNKRMTWSGINMKLN